MHAEDGHGYVGKVLQQQVLGLLLQQCVQVVCGVLVVGCQQ